MDTLLNLLLEGAVKTGTLKVTSASGRQFCFGDGTGDPVALRIASAKAQRRILIDPHLRLGEAFVEGDLIVEEGQIFDFLDLIFSQNHTRKLLKWLDLPLLLRYLLRRAQQLNGRGRSRRNVAHHYDLDSRLYDLFLDSDRQYSCAYFETPNQSLEEAQQAKKRHIAAKLLIRHGMDVLDVGSGWGGLALYLSKICGARTTGITLSEEQFSIAQNRAALIEGCDASEFRNQDYRDVAGKFDRIVSVGMFEHVGVNHYDQFFQQCSQLLKDDGVMLLHSIGRINGPGFTNPWIAKYVFPGGYIPALSEVLPAIERTGLIVTDLEILRLHYAETLRNWRERFQSRRREAAELYNERFVRIWEFYLACSEIAFRRNHMMVFQIQLSKQLQAVPRTRDYIAQEEVRLRSIERASEAFAVAAE